MIFSAFTGIESIKRVRDINSILFIKSPPDTDKPGSLYFAIVFLFILMI